jgi:hypothetical protein
MMYGKLRVNLSKGKGKLARKGTALVDRGGGKNI